MKLPVTKTVTLVVVDDEATGKIVRAWREKKGLSLRQFATDMAVSVPYMSDLELGRRSWGGPKGDRILRCIGGSL